MFEITLIAICLLLFVRPIFANTVGPFIVWKVQKLPAVVKFEIIDENTFLESQNQHFVVCNNALRQLGFESVGSSVLRDSHTNSYFRLFYHNELKLVATAVTVKSEIEELTYAEISQKYDNGGFFNVSNSSRTDVYPKLDIKTVYRFPSASIEGLVENHSILKSKYMANATPVEFDLDRGFEEIEAFIWEESEALLKKGIVKEAIDADGKRSLTLFGAMLLTHRSISPGKNIWGYITEKKAMRALAAAK